MEKFSFSKALEQIRGKSFDGEKKILGLAMNNKKVAGKKPTGGFLIPFEFTNRIILHLVVSDYKTKGKKLTKQYIDLLIKDWEECKGLLESRNDHITKLNKSLKWYKARHKK